MIEKLRIQNFRCFADHTIPFNTSTTVIVGRNNAGKSTIVEALRLVSIVGSRHLSLNYHPVPRWLEIPLNCRGVSPDIKDIEFNEKATFFDYQDPPAIIEATFRNGAVIRVYLGPEQEIHAVILKNDIPATTRREASAYQVPRLSIMPQVGPMNKKEVYLTPDYVRRAASSPLSPLHFRNQLRVFGDYFELFKKLCEETWPKLQIQELVGEYASDIPWELFVRNEGFVADVGAMGHGLQMWLQTMWYLARSEEDSTVILDEPDVYLHADLQRKLIRLLMQQNRQVVVTTHSVEIMAEVEAENILIIERDKANSRFATTLPAVQRIISFIGSVHNIHLTRLWNARKCLLVEGKDVRLLKVFQNILFFDSNEPLDVNPNMPIGGWSGWNYAIGSSMLIKNSVGKNITVYCILDRDYHLVEEIEERYEKAEEKEVRLHIWRKKEIENYLLVPTAIHRLITSKARPGKKVPTVEHLELRLDQICNELKDEVFDALSNEFEIIRRDTRTKSNALAREFIRKRWGSLSEKLSIVSGKEVIARLSEWAQTECGAQLNPVTIARQMKRIEISQEVIDVITSIENGEPFPGPLLTDDWPLGTSGVPVPDVPKLA